MRGLLIGKLLSSNVVSVNRNDNKNTHINIFVPTESAQLLLQLDIISCYSIVLVNGTSCIIVKMLCYWLRGV